jgi:hypothetical protein
LSLNNKMQVYMACKSLFPALLIYICNEDTSMLVFKLQLPLKLDIVADVCLIILVESN